MYDVQFKQDAYRRGVMYFIFYSVILFVATDAIFWNIKSLFYFPIGFALSGIVAVFFMLLQYKVETGLRPNFWILNIVIDIVGYYVFTQALFYLFFQFEIYLNDYEFSR